MSTLDSKRANASVYVDVSSVWSVKESVMLHPNLLQNGPHLKHRAQEIIDSMLLS